MAKEESTTTKAAPAKAAAAPKDAGATAKDTTAKAEKAAPDRGERVSTCVVNDGYGMHVGNAVNGAVCSYHAMHYDNAGNRR